MVSGGAIRTSRGDGGATQAGRASADPRKQGYPEAIDHYIGGEESRCPVADITLALAEDGADPARLDQLSRQLRDELGHLALAEVSPVPGPPAPPGTRGPGADAVGTLAVALMGSGGLTAVITAVRAWLDRGHQAPRSIRLEVDGDVLELSGASAVEHDQLVSVFLSRHEKGPSWTADAQP